MTSEVKMTKKATINLAENSKQMLTEALCNALLDAAVDSNTRNLSFVNGVGVSNLNYIFQALLSIQNEGLFVNRFKRGCFESVILYEVDSKSLVSFTSKANMKRLLNRDEILKAHYMDALLSLNTDFEGDFEQVSMFDTPLNWQEDRLSLCLSLTNKIRNCGINQHYVCEYNISHKEFCLQEINCCLYSSNYIKLCSENLSKYILPNYSDRSAQTYETLKEEKEELNTLGIKLKSNINKQA